MDHVPDLSELGALLTVREAAERLRCDPETVRRHIAAGTIPAFRLPGLPGKRPGRWRIRAADVDRLVTASAA